MAQIMLEWVNKALKELEDYPNHWVTLRMSWFREYAKGRISSTRHGFDFFVVAHQALTTKTYQFADNEYDRNFANILAEHGVKIYAQSK